MSHSRSSLTSFIDEVAQPFLAQHPTPSLAELLQWKPKNTPWSRVRKAQTRLSGMQRRTQRIDGLELCYLQGGNPNKPTVVLIHGFGANKENWLLLGRLLTRYYQVVIPDVPGYGESEFNPHKDYRLVLQAQRLSELLASITPEPLHLVGNSLGGATAAVWAAHHPQQVLSLTLMNSAGLRGHRPTRFETQLQQGKNPLIPKSYREVAQLFKLATHRHRRLFSALLTPILYEDFKHRSLVNHRLFSDAIVVDEGLVSILQGIQCPTLVIWGEKDAILDVSCTEIILEQLPHAASKIIPNVGHLPMLEAPVQCAQALKQFWRRQ